MKRYLSLLLAAFTLSLSAAAQADSWECDGPTGCFVTNVRFFTGTPHYVRAEISDPDNNTTCEFVKFAVDSNVEDVDSLLSTESIFLTAFSSGLPIRFYRRSAFGSTTDCYANYVDIMR